jgi:hypothetical protein
VPAVLHCKIEDATEQGFPRFCALDETISSRYRINPEIDLEDLLRDSQERNSTDGVIIRQRFLTRQQNETQFERDVDHNEIRRQLWILRMLVSKGEREDYEVAETRSVELQALLGSHFVKEDPFKDISRITTFLTREEKLSVFDNFEGTLLSCLKEEEELE